MNPFKLLHAGQPGSSTKHYRKRGGDRRQPGFVDGFFVFCNNADPTERNVWSDLPASYHNGAAGFSFADGHSEIKKWMAATTIRAALKKTTDFPIQVGTDKRDITWVAERTTTPLN
jgi:prepilin-type processing-associated H-X9-DG protein